MFSQGQHRIADLSRVRELRRIAYLCFVDALTGLKRATDLIDARVQKDGPRSSYSINSDLLDWSLQAWKQSCYTC